MASPVVRFRAKPETYSALCTLKKEWQYNTLSSVVAQLMSLGLTYVEDRKREIQKMRDRLIELKVKPYELRLPS